MELAAHIKSHRTERGMSQEELAARIYVSRQTISNWETGKTYPDVESLLLLSVLFDVTVDELIKGDVETMKKKLDAGFRKMSAYAGIGLALAVAGVALLVGGLSFWDWKLAPSLIIGLIFWGGSMVFLCLVENIKKEHDLVTCREIVAFAKGDPIDRDNPRSRRARQHRLAKGILATTVSAGIGAVLGYFSYALLLG